MRLRGKSLAYAKEMFNRLRGLDFLSFSLSSESGMITATRDSGSFLSEKLR